MYWHTNVWAFSKHFEMLSQLTFLVYSVTCFVCITNWLVFHNIYRVRVSFYITITSRLSPLTALTQTHEDGGYVPRSRGALFTTEQWALVTGVATYRAWLGSGVGGGTRGQGCCGLVGLGARDRVNIWTMYSNMNTPYEYPSLVGAGVFTIMYSIGRKGWAGEALPSSMAEINTSLRQPH